jgi:integrase
MSCGFDRVSVTYCWRRRRRDILATTALRISEVSGLQVRDVDIERGLLHVSRQTYPGRGGLVTKQTKGRRRRAVPVIEPLRPTLARLTVDRDPEERLVTGPRGGVITTATLRDATGWDQLVADLGLPGLVRHGLRHTALTWMAEAGRRTPPPAAGGGAPGPGRDKQLPSPRRPSRAPGRDRALAVVGRFRFSDNAS